MSNAGHNASVEMTIEASPEQVWHGLTSPGLIKEYMMGAEVSSNWEQGASISWSGQFNGKAFKDSGTVTRSEKPNRLTYTHTSGSDGATHTVDILLQRAGDGTMLTLQQDNNSSEEARKEAEKNWSMMLQGMKKLVEH